MIGQVVNMMGEAKLHDLSAISAAGDLCYVAVLPDDAPPGDDVHDSDQSTLRLFEDGSEIGPAHALHADITRNGSGAFSHWGRQLYFSSSDRTDPRANGRRYTILYDVKNKAPHRRVVASALHVDFAAVGPEERYAWGERLFNALVPNVRLSEFGRSMFRDEEFRADYERFDRANYHSYDRKFALRELLKLTMASPGDVAECGVYRGASAFLLAKALAADAAAKRLHLFDSFAGLPAPGPQDGRYWKQGALACSAADVAANLAEFARLTVLHQGWIPQCFAEAADCSFSFVHIDVDLYDPTRAALEFFAPRMTADGIIVCDDYGFETCPGARRAMDEWACARSIPVVHLPTGQGVVFVDRAASFR